MGRTIFSADESLEMTMAQFPVLGLDLSLTGTGYAIVENGVLATGGTFKALGTSDLARVRSVRSQAEDLLTFPPPALICVEGLAYGSMVGRSSTRAGMWWLVADRLDSLGYRVVAVEPTRLKKFATGKGNSSKDQMMLATARAFHDFDGDNNQADAVWLAVFGAYAMGQAVPVRSTSYRDAAARAYSDGTVGW